MRRREFIALAGGATLAWPIALRAQQPAMSVIGFLSTTSSGDSTERLRVFRQSLKDNGYVEGQNVTIEFRWAENQSERLAELAADLVRRRVAVIVTSGGACFGFRSQGGDCYDPHRFRRQRGPCQAWSCRKPRPARRQPDRFQYFL